MHESLEKGKLKRSSGQVVAAGAGNLRDGFRGCMEGKGSERDDREGDGMLFRIS